MRGETVALKLARLGAPYFSMLVVHPDPPNCFVFETPDASPL